MNGPWVHDSKQARLWANQLVFNASILYPKLQCYTQCEKEKKTFWWKSATSAVNSKAPKFFLNPKTVTKTKSVNSKAFQIEQKNKQTKKHPKLKNKNKKPLFLKKKPWKHFWYLPRYENEKRKKMKFSNFWMLNDWIWLSQVRIVEGKKCRVGKMAVFVNSSTPHVLEHRSPKLSRPQHLEVREVKHHEVSLVYIMNQCNSI